MPSFVMPLNAPTGTETIAFEAKFLKRNKLVLELTQYWMIQQESHCSQPGEHV